MKKIVIIGGGLTGLSLAYFLEKNSIPYILLEKENDFGGLCKTAHINNYKFDYTGHLLHLKTERVKTFIFDELNLEKKFSKLKRNSKIYMLNRLIDYPFQANIDQLPENVRKECIEGFKKRDTKINPVTFEDWIRKYFGDAMGKYFFYPYNEKLWRTKCSELSYKWTGRYVPKVEMKDIIKKKKELGYNSYFYYPAGEGIDIIPRTIEKTLNSLNIIKNEEVTDVNYKRKTVNTNKTTYKYDVLINTIPLNKFLNMCSIENKLKALSVLNINIGFQEDSYRGVHWIYFPEKQFPFYRVGYYSHFNGNMAPPGYNSVYIEISYMGNSDINNGIIEEKELNKFSYIRNIIDTLKSTGIINGKIDLIHINKIETAYVIYDFYRENNLGRFIKLLEENDIFSIGRYGSWLYNSMEDNILQAWNTVESIKAIL